MSLDLPADLPLVMADPPRIEAVLRNLIENAVQYSPAQAGIRLSAEAQDGRVTVRVADEGPGIPIEHQEKVFDRFYRIESGLVQQTSGAGLGLAICKGFVEAHGGRIWVEPSASGAIFAFSLSAVFVTREPAPASRGEALAS